MATPTPKFGTDEKGTSQLPAMLLLAKMGWQPLTKAAANAARRNRTSAVILEDITRAYLRTQRLSWAGEEVPLSEDNIDTLMTRIAHIRTWTYITNKNGWTDAKQDWQELAKSIEDRLSDELHNRLTQRFVDRRAAHLSRRLKESTTLMASVRLDGTVLVEGEEVGLLDGSVLFTMDIAFPVVPSCAYKVGFPHGIRT